MPGVRCTARSARTGEPCKRYATRGGNVCTTHGGSAPQVQAAARRRLEQAADVLVQRLLGFALDGEVADPVALAAIRDALDRAGMNPKTAIEIEVKPWEQVAVEGIARISRAESRQRRGIPDTAPALAAGAADDSAVIDAEIVPDTDGPVSAPERHAAARNPGDPARPHTPVG